MYKARVLVLEDDFYQAEDSRSRLSEAGADVVVMTGTTRGALASLDKVPIDIGLLDVNLGGVKSFDVVRALRERGVPVLLLTGYEPFVLPPDLTDTPMITKPADWDAVIARLEELLA
ncbi:MAG: response regulator [Erythrobacter sp.]